MPDTLSLVTETGGRGTSGGPVRTFRWTRRPAWHVARGWRVLATKQGYDYQAWLVAR